MYGSVGMSEENMNEEGIVLLVHNSSPSDEERQQNLEIFRKKFTKSDWAEVGRRLKTSIINPFLQDIVLITSEKYPVITMFHCYSPLSEMLGCLFF